MPGEKYLFKKGWLVLVTVLLVFIISLTGYAVADEVKNPLAIDMVIAIDDRYENYMGEKNDENGLRFDAAAALISMCDAQYSRAAYFMFNRDLLIYEGNQKNKNRRVEAGNITMVDISLPEHRPQRIGMMTGLSGEKIRHYEDATNRFHEADLGKALDAAVSAELRDDNGNRKVIILVSSGGTKLSSESQKMAENAKTRAIENGIEIYTVAWRSHANAQTLQSLATKSDNYQFVANVEDLIDVYRKFFADMIGAQPREIKSTKLGETTSQIKLTVPNESVAEVNLIIPLKRVEDLMLTDPEGKQIVKTDDKVLLNKSTNFFTYKLIKPSAADYMLQYNSEDEREIVVQYVFSYSVQVQAETSARELSKHKPVTISARYYEGNIPSKDSKLYNIPATLTLFKGNRQIAIREMDRDIDGKSYKLTLENLMQYGAGDYTAKIHFEGDGLVRECETSFTLLNDAPTLINDGRIGESFQATINKPKDTDSYEPQKNKMEWDLNAFVADANGDALTAEVVEVPDTVDVSCKEMKLSIMPRRNTAANGEVHVVVSDTDGAKSPELVFPVSVENYEERYDAYTASFDPIKDFDKKSRHKLVLRLYDGKGIIVKGDGQLPDTVEAIVTSSLGQISTVLKAENDCWTGTIETGDTTAEYSINAGIVIGQKTVNAQTLLLTSHNHNPIPAPGKDMNQNWTQIINDPQDASSYEVQEKEWDLDEYVIDPNNDQVIFKIKDKPENVMVSIGSDNKLVIKSKLNTRARETITITSEDPEGAQGPEMTITVSIINKEEPYSDYTAELSVNTEKKSSEVAIILSVYKAGSEGGRILDIDDVNLPREIKATVTQGRNETPVTLTRGEDGKWIGTFQSTNRIAEYTIATQVEISRNQIITPKNLVFTTINTEPVIKKEKDITHDIPTVFNVEPFLFWNDETAPVDIDLDEYFTDPDGDKLEYSLSDSTTAVLSKNKLTVNGEGVKDKASFTVTAKDNDNASKTTETITYTIHSLKKQGLITIGIIVAVLIFLLILIHAIKPKYPYGAFEVAVDKVPFGEGPELPKGKAAKKKAKLQNYAPTLAKNEYGSTINAALGFVTIKPSFGRTVKIDAAKARNVNISINKKKDSRKGKLSDKGTVNISDGNKDVIFILKIKTSGRANKKTSVTTSTSKTVQSQMPHRPSSRT